MRDRTVLPRTGERDWTAHNVPQQQQQQQQQQEACSQHKGDEGLPVPRVALVLAGVEVVAQLRRQALVEQHVEDHQPPGERQAAHRQAEAHVDQQLGQVVRAGHQLEPAAPRQHVGQRLHRACETTNRGNTAWAKRRQP
ncbi:hypothetical protein EYF80_048972 [Liparis tanakae]|uniref:Uncharacterized protein n=1 Tax=Liparis tanakae TaxID=230148 RepID=A0A4Z2FHZ9_9TELE|nr:hypothetical protein EYF80_048972 [Liparis tanakae]